jgi:hypothetical protein
MIQSEIKIFRPVGSLIIIFWGYMYSTVGSVQYVRRFIPLKRKVEGCSIYQASSADAGGCVLFDENAIVRL